MPRPGNCANRKHPYVERVIRDETLDGFRGAVRARIAGDPGGADRLRAAIHALAAEARAAALSAEELVIRVKTECESLIPHDASWMHAPTSEIRDGIITSAIRAYYVQ